MTDDQILDSVRLGLAGARMHRPVDDILRLARSRRRTRAVTAVAAASVCAVAAFAAAPPDHSTPVLAGPSPSAAPLQPVSFTLVQGSDGTYTFDVVPGVPLDTAAVEQALQGIGISAVVRVGERCMGEPFEPPPGPRFIRFITRPDGVVSLVLDAHRISSGATLSLGLGVSDRGQLVAASMSVFAAGTQRGCERFTVFQSGASASQPR